MIKPYPLLQYCVTRGRDAPEHEKPVRCPQLCRCVDAKRGFGAFIDKLAESAMTLPFANVQTRAWPRLRREAVLFALPVLAAGAVMVLYFGFHPAMSRPSEAGWTGQLAAAAPGPLAESLSSASLVVPKDQLALPPDPVKPKPRVRAVCDSAEVDCIARAPLASVVPPAPAPASARKTAVLDERMLVRDPAVKVPPRPPGLIPNPPPAGKNPSGHPNPDKDQHPSFVAIAARPFVAVGNTVSRWINNL